MINKDDPNVTDSGEWEMLSPEEKKIRLYLNQKELLDGFLNHGAITREQYNKSFSDLTEKMGMQKYAQGKDN